MCGVNLDCRVLIFFNYFYYLGPGLLTRSILDAGARRVVVVEKDPRFVPTLQVCSLDSPPPPSFPGAC